jgi:hypothetical protein
MTLAPSFKLSAESPQTPYFYGMDFHTSSSKRFKIPRQKIAQVVENIALPFVNPVVTPRYVYVRVTFPCKTSPTPTHRGQNEKF